MESVAPQVPDYIVWQDVEGDLVLFDCRSGGYLSLNGTATTIWRSFARGEGFMQTIERLVADYDAPREVLEADVAAFVELALSKGLLVTRVSA
jgi:hypothetical protein